MSWQGCKFASLQVCRFAQYAGYLPLAHLPPAHLPPCTLAHSPLAHYNSLMLILTHENGDFDAIASLLAAHKLYPNGRPLLPRRVNRNVEQFLTG